MARDVTVRREAEREMLRRGWRRSGWYARVAAGDALEAGARRRPDDRIVFSAVGGATEVASLASLHRHARTLAGGLRAAGVTPGSVVAVQAPADRASTEILQALWLVGAVVVPVVLTAGHVELDRIVEDVDAAYLMVTPEWRGEDLVTRAVEIQRERRLAAAFVIGNDADTGAVPTGRLAQNESVPSTRIEPSTTCCVLYTSGSSAAPKGVQHTHETLLAGLTALPADVTTGSLAAFPSGHVAALLGLLRPLCVGGTTAMMDRWSASHAASLIEEFRLDTSAGTPFFLSTLLDESDRSGRDISSLRRYLIGAASVPPSLVARADDRGIVSWRTYGSTEHPTISSGGARDSSRKRRFTDGRVGPGNEVRLLDHDGHDVPREEQGEIVARGPKQFLGYRNSALDEGAFIDTSWFRTGDLGRFDEDGYLTVTDRLKDVIIRGGENVSAREVEDALETHPSIREVAVCAAPDETWGESICAFVVPDDHLKPSLDDLRAHLIGAGLARHKTPSNLVLVDELPRTPAGKVRKHELRQALTEK